MKVQNVVRDCRAPDHLCGVGERESEDPVDQVHDPRIPQPRELQESDPLPLREATTLLTADLEDPKL